MLGEDEREGGRRGKYEKIGDAGDSGGVASQGQEREEGQANRSRIVGRSIMMTVIAVVVLVILTWRFCAAEDSKRMLLLGVVMDKKRKKKKKEERREKKIQEGGGKINTKVGTAGTVAGRLPSIRYGRAGTVPRGLVAVLFLTQR